MRLLMSMLADSDQGVIVVVTTVPRTSELSVLVISYSPREKSCAPFPRKFAPADPNDSFGRVLDLDPSFNITQHGYDVDVLCYTKARIILRKISFYLLSMSGLGHSHLEVAITHIYMYVP